jgi:hypothetical protein
MTHVAVDPAHANGRWARACSLITTELGWTAAAILAVAYVVTLGLLSPLTLQDYPAHLANAVTLNDLIFHGGAHFGGMYRYQFLFVPYLLGDFGFTLVIDVLGPRLGGALWLAVIVLSLPCALLFFMRATGVAAERRPLVFILSLYLATDWFFLMGFLSFRLGLALTIVNLALLSLLRRRWSTRSFAIYSVLVVLGYLVHLTTIVFLGAAVGVSGFLRLWRRTSTLRTEALLMAPILVMCAWHFGVAVGYTLPSDPAENPYIWGTLYDKFLRLNYEFVRFHRHLDLQILIGLAACVLVSAGRVRLRDLRESAFIEMLVLAVMFVAMYIALPMGYSEAWYVDVRPLALVSICVVLACASLPAGRSWLRVPGPALAIVPAIALVAGNLAYLERHLIRDQAWLGQYRAIVAAVPVGAHVLPIDTHGAEGHVNPFVHANSFIAIDRRGLMPYAFTADTANPEKYLRYVHKPYRPDEKWYVNRSRGDVDWRSVASDYDYVLATKPFDPRRIPLRTTTVAENPSATLLAINK